MASRFPSLSAKCGSDRRPFRTVFCIVLVMAVCAPLLAQQPTAPAAPQVLVAVKLRDPNFRILHIKFRAFYNKFENNVVPLTDYDLAASASDEIMNALSGDARARWRLATTDEKMYTESYFDEKTAQGNLPASIAADRLLLVDIGGFSLSTHSTAHRMFAVGALKMIDRPSGRILWKKGVVHKLEGYKGHTDEELLADNQKMLKELLNKLIEEFSVEIKKKVAENPI